MNKKILLAVIPLLTVFGCTQKAPETISVTNWNVQTFFDGNNDGIEYSEFKNKNSKWNAELYKARLEKLCRKIEQFNSDIFIMEELENEKIIYDISNRLSRNSWFKNKMYRYAAFQKEHNASIGCGIISKYEIAGVKIHSLDVRTEKEKAPPLRPVMEIRVNAGETPVVIFVNHWKSKSGGAEKSEKWRLWQESVLARVFEDKRDERFCIAAGDFNKDVNEFCRSGADSLFLRPVGSKRKEPVAVFSVWDAPEEQDGGSYFFRGSWEKIDNFFSTQNCMTDFRVEKDGGLLTSDGTPNRYTVFSGNGYSDHLPISCSVKINCPEL